MWHGRYAKQETVTGTSVKATFLSVFFLSFKDLREKKKNGVSLLCVFLVETIILVILTAAAWSYKPHHNFWKQNGWGWQITV